jgi:hypothetical protein
MQSTMLAKTPTHHEGRSEAQLATSQGKTIPLKPAQKQTTLHVPQAKAEIPIPRRIGVGLYREPPDPTP